MRDLNTVQTQIHQTRQRKKRLAAECVVVANGFLLEAENSQFKNRNHLRSAAQYFLKALELNLRYLEAYLGLIFISSLVNQYEKAHQLLQQAKAIAPEDERIQILEQELKRLEAIGAGQQPVTREGLLAQIRKKREDAKKNAPPLPELRRVSSLRVELEEGDVGNEDDEYYDDEYYDDEYYDEEYEDETGATAPGKYHKNPEVKTEPDFDPETFNIFDFEGEDDD